MGSTCAKHMPFPPIHPEVPFFGGGGVFLSFFNKYILFITLYVYVCLFYKYLANETLNRACD